MLLFTGYKLSPSPKFSLLLTSLMVFVAYCCADGVFLVPVFASFAYGVASGLARWSCTWRQFVALLGLSALAGVLTVRVGSGYLSLDIVAVCVIVTVLLARFKSCLHPAYAVAVLPVFLSENRFTYVLVVLSMALLLVTLFGGSLPSRQSRNDGADGMLVDSFLFLLVALAPLFLFAHFFSNPCFVSPVLWYVAAEFSQGEGPELRHVTQLLFAVVLGAVTDVAATRFLDYSGVDGCGVASVVYAVVALIALLLFSRVVGDRVFLPALAFVIFPLLRDGETSYVLATDFSIVYIAMAGRAIRYLCAISFKKQKNT